MFINRTRELGYLSDRYAIGRAEIVVLYGRRRVGKSALLFEWSEDKPCIFFFDRGNRWLNGDSGWDVNYALVGRDMGQAPASAGGESGFYFFFTSDIVQTSA